MDDIASLPPGAIPAEEFDQSQTPVAATQLTEVPPGAIPAESFQSQEEKYGTIGQQAIAGLEGVAHGVLGPLATSFEKHFIGVPDADILGRERANPITHGIGQAAGLGAGLLTGTGEAAVMTKAGELAASAAGLGKVAEGASYGYKVGSEVVKQAAEMAVLQGSDEVSKMLLNDPDTSAQTALTDIGLSAALGGAGGAFIAGVASPLWGATVGPQVEKLLTTLKGHLDGSAKAILPETLENSVRELGIELSPEMKSAISGDPMATNHFNTLKYAQNPKIFDQIEKLQTDTSNAVMNSLGVPLEEVQSYSKNEAGHSLLDTFKKEYEAKYAPVEAAMQERNKVASTFQVPDEVRLNHYGKLLESGIEKVGTDSPLYKLYDQWGERMLAKDTIGGLDSLKTEIYNEIKKAERAADYNTVNALKDIRGSIADMQEKQIVDSAKQIEKEGGPGIGERRRAEAMEAGAKRRDLVGERQAANQTYANFAHMSDELLDHTGAGNFKGAGTLVKKLESVGAEGLLNKFSPKNNADIIPFLKEHFPDTLEHVRKNELKDLIKPAINSAKGESPINVNRLADIIKKNMSGKKELMGFALPEKALNNIEAAERLLDAIPKTRDSGTPGGLMKLLNKMPQSAMAAVGMLMGHNPIFGYVLGEMAQKLGRETPDALRLAHLRFLGSTEPIKAEGFKAMVDFFHNTYKGQNLISKATSNVFKAGAEVLPVKLIPNATHREKLDKQVSDIQANPDKMQAMTDGHVGHYLPEHQQAVAQASATAVQYLQSIKPQPVKLSPLGKEIPPSQAQIARYNRALDIAQQPAVILKHVKEGTLQLTDIQDLHSMYPALYSHMAQQLSSHMTGSVANEEAVPYKTRIGLSLFLGQPMDSTMTPQSILASQPKPPEQPQQGGGDKPRNRPSSLGKTNKLYQTPEQSAAQDRADRA